MHRKEAPENLFRQDTAARHKGTTQLRSRNKTIKLSRWKHGAPVLANSCSELSFIGSMHVGAGLLVSKLQTTQLVFPSWWEAFAHFLLQVPGLRQLPYTPTNYICGVWIPHARLSVMRLWTKCGVLFLNIPARRLVAYNAGAGLRFSCSSGCPQRLTALSSDFSLHSLPYPGSLSTDPGCMFTAGTSSSFCA